MSIVITSYSIHYTKLYDVDKDRGPYIIIKTLEGRMCANLDDWIIQGVKGEFYPCKPDIFEATYDPL